ncbi:MAG: ATP-binding protein, partial [Opitutales bacterium]|nr:ATP-binding protein [Opitutales bacterium]
LLDLINEILDLSKIEAGKVFMDVTAVRLDEAIHEVTSLFRLNAERSGIQLVVELDDKVVESVMTDRTRLQQVMNNLVSNAVKFTPHGEIRIKVWGENHDERAGMRYYISISDTGIGIPVNKLSDVFLAFTQADSSTTRKYGGTGLGLAISSRLVELLGGEISVESTEGLGSKFTFYIRNLEGSAHGSDDNRSYANQELNFETLPQVLLVEDDVANYTLASKILGRVGLSVDWAKNGLEAVDAVKLKQYDLVFMDLQMPVMDGIEATIQIHQLGLAKQPYIAALTANALSESRNACAQAGMQDFITKPVSGEALRVALLRFQEHTINQG